MQKFKSYLDSLTYSGELSKSVISKYLTNIRLVILIVAAIVMFGTYAFFALPKRLNPEVKIPIITIVTSLPSASPKDVESLVTIPIENEVKGLDNISNVTSTSREGLSTVVLEFNTGINVDKTKSDVESAVSSINNLPEDANDSIVSEIDFENQSVWTFALTTDAELSDLYIFSNQLKDSLEDQSFVKSVVLSGYENQEIQVNLDINKVKEYKISVLNISEQIRAYLSSYPAGNVQTNSSSIAVSIDKEIASVEDIRNLLINVNNTQIPLKEIADIQESSISDQPKSFYTKDSTKNSVIFNIYKSDNVNIVESGQMMRSFVDSKIKDTSFTYHTVFDLTKDIDTQFGDLFNNLATTIVLVFISLFIFMGVRQAIIASSTIPLTFLIAHIVMLATGIDLSFLSLFALLIALGLLVDDTIVVITAITSYYKTGKFTPQQAGILTFRDFLIPIFTTTITTVWAFVPLLLSTGIIGEFIKPIPIIVSSTLLASTTVAVFITLPFMMFILKPNIPSRVFTLFKFVLTLVFIILFLFLIPKSAYTLLVIGIFLVNLFLLYLIKDYIVARYKHLIGKIHTGKLSSKLEGYLQNGVVDASKITEKYSETLRNIINSKSSRIRVLLGVVIFSVFSYLLVPFGFVVNEFFPKSDNDFLYVTYKLSDGTKLDFSTQEAKELLDSLKNVEGVDFIVTEVGKSIGDSGSVDSLYNNVLYTLVLPDKSSRKVDSLEIAENVRTKFRDYPQGEVSVVEVSGGPPAGSDIVVKFLGDDLNVLQQYADKLVAYLEQDSQISSVDKSVSDVPSKLVFVPSQSELLKNNVSVRDLNFWLRFYTSTYTVDDITINEESKDIVIRLPQNGFNANDLGSINVVNTQGSVVSLSELGSFELQPNTTSIFRENGKRVVTVSAGVIPGYSVSGLNQKALKYVEDMNLPVGYSFDTGGVNEENTKSVTSILYAMILSAVLILATMVLQLSSFRKAVIVLLVIPLAVSGVFVVFALFGIPLSFPALIGVLALFGIVVNNSIVIVDKINQNLSVNMDFEDSIVDASSSRLEPILFSSLTTILGLIPITLSDPLWQGLGGAIISGLTFSGAIMLLFIPVVYYMVYKKESV